MADAQDDEFDQKRLRNLQQLQSRMDAIIAKYSQPFENTDIIDLETETIVEDHEAEDFLLVSDDEDAVNFQKPPAPRAKPRAKKHRAPSPESGTDDVHTPKRASKNGTGIDKEESTPSKRRLELILEPESGTEDIR